MCQVTRSYLYTRTVFLYLVCFRFVWKWIRPERVATHWHNKDNRPSTLRTSTQSNSHVRTLCANTKHILTENPSSTLFLSLFILSHYSQRQLMIVGVFGQFRFYCQPGHSTPCSRWPCVSELYYLVLLPFLLLLLSLFTLHMYVSWASFQNPFSIQFRFTFRLY